MENRGLQRRATLVLIRYILDRTVVLFSPTLGRVRFGDLLHCRFLFGQISQVGGTSFFR